MQSCMAELNELFTNICHCARPENLVLQRSRRSEIGLKKSQVNLRHSCRRERVDAFTGSLAYIPLSSSSTVPSGSLKQTTPICVPPGPATFFSGATNSTLLAFRSS